MSDAKDGTVPPEPVGPMEDAPMNAQRRRKLIPTTRWISPISRLRTSFEDNHVIPGGDH
jgi:hypothetical protein